MTSLAIALRTRTFRSLSRHRNYRIFFAGQLVSLAGSWMQNVALAWLVLELSGSPLAVGALVFWRFVPFTVFGLAAGVVADRVDSRKLVMATQGVALVVSVALAVITLTGTATLSIVYVLAALGGITLAFDAPGRQSLTYQMVGPRSLPNAVALNAGLFNGSRVIGPAIAGVVIAVAGTGICFVINAFSFLAVLAALASLRQDELHPVERDPSARIVEGMRRALRFVRHDPQLRSVLGVVTVISTVGFNFHVLVPLLAADTLHVGPEGFGLLSASFGLGALVGALVTASFRRASWRLFATGATGFGVLALALAPVEDAVPAGMLLFAVGISFTLFTANANALVQLGAPDHLRGRMIGLYLFAFVGLAPVGGLLTGWLADLGGTQLAFAVAGATSLATIGIASLQRRAGAEGIDRRARRGVGSPRLKEGGEMKRRTRWALGAVLLAVAVGLIVPAVVGAGPGSTATVRFGNPTVGSPFQPPVFDHDASFKAADTLIPQTSVISSGGNVTFDVAGFHQVMVYGPGTTLDDIDVPPFPPESNILINEDEGLLDASPLPFTGFQGPWIPDADTFEEPGRYLVLCNVTPHLVFGKMYGWVNVK